MLPRMYLCQQTSPSFSPQLGTRTRWGTHSSLPCSPQHSVKPVAASRFLAHITSLVENKSEVVTDALKHSLPSCRPFIWCMGDWEQTGPQKDPILTLTVKEEHGHFIGCGILGFPGRPGDPMKRFLLLRRDEFAPWASVSVKLFSCYNIKVKLQ